MYYAEALPSEAARQSARDDLGTDDLRELAPRSDSWWAETYQLRGVEVQIGHTTVADVEQRSLAEALDPVERHMPEADNTLVRRRPHSDAYLRPMLVHTCIGKSVASVTEGEAAPRLPRGRRKRIRTCCGGWARAAFQQLQPGDRLAYHQAGSAESSTAPARGEPDTSSVARSDIRHRRRGVS